MQDAWRAYLELAFGLTEASRKKAREVAKEVLGRGGATAAQVQAFVDDLVSTSRANREELARLVRYEVDRALGAVGLATAEEVADLTNRLRELERRLSETGAATAGTGRPAGGQPAAAPHPVKPPAAKKAVAKKAVAKKVVAKRSGPTAGKKAG
jgi:polyhydroxyalkanoate synthesis regulator phasin